jgi:hypothetical protein
LTGKLEVISNLKHAIKSNRLEAFRFK